MQRLGGVRYYAAFGSKDLKIDGVKDVIAVASGKGGVGKSTTAGISSSSEWLNCSNLVYSELIERDFVCK